MDTLSTLTPPPATYRYHPPLLTDAEVATWLAISVLDLQHDRLHGTLGLPYVQVGELGTRYRQRDVEIWLDQNTHQPYPQVLNVAEMALAYDTIEAAMGSMLPATPTASYADTITLGSTVPVPVPSLVRLKRKKRKNKNKANATVVVRSSELTPLSTEETPDSLPTTPPPPPPHATEEEGSTIPTDDGALVVAIAQVQWWIAPMESVQTYTNWGTDLVGDVGSAVVAVNAMTPTDVIAQTEWRLPTVAEMAGLSYTDHCPHNGWYWCADTHPDPELAWAMSFDHGLGAAFAIHRSAIGKMRLVRSRLVPTAPQSQDDEVVSGGWGGIPVTAWSQSELQDWYRTDR